MMRPFSREVVTLAPSSRCTATLPDGRIITGSSIYGEVKLWRDGACERTIPVNANTVSAVVMLGGARFVSLSTGNDDTATLWTLDGNLERTINMGGKATGKAIQAMPDGLHFVVGLCGPWEIKLYHVDGTLVHTFTGHTDSVKAVAVTRDGQHIISGSYDKTVKVWSVASKSLVSTCEGHTSWVKAVAVMPDGQRILSGGWDTTVRVHLLNGTLENTFELHTYGVTALVALPDNQHALSGWADGAIKLFNVNDGAVLRTFKHHTQSVWSLALLPGGLRFVSGSTDKTARIAYHGLAPQ